MSTLLTTMAIEPGERAVTEGTTATLSDLFANIAGFNNIIVADYAGRLLNHTQAFFAVMIVALAMGVIMSLLYKGVTKKGTPSQNFAITLMLLPPVIAAVVFLIGTNIAAAFSLAGIFSFTRFRSAAANSKDLSFIFVTMAIGIACGIGYVSHAVAISALLCFLLLVLSITNYGESKSEPKILRINVPESISYGEMFTPIFEKYSYSWDLMRVKLVDLGATYEVSYSIALKLGINEKEMIDELRTRNGNLNITLMLAKRDDRVQM
ncbi:MAG: DUF4956 domain-containing protein [Oscillospiraceae bacterium]|nr:DUF4956 domain-containing protein [Oscillospiraceae bacterium]